MSPFLLGAVVVGAPWVVVTEIHYHPPGDEALEFVELHLKNAPRADLSGWRLDGEVSFRFPEGTVAMPGEYIVVARDPGALAARHPRLAVIYGPFEGRLDNKGGRITVRNAAGARVSEVRYDREREWTAVPDGTGHSLALKDPNLDPADPRNWEPSRVRGGTPGSDNRVAAVRRAPRLVREGETWRFFLGREAPPSGWQGVAFDDGAWKSGPTGIGYGDDDDATELEDMRGGYMSVFARRSFRVEDPAAFDRLVLVIDYDDGFIAFLNGVEVARANMGAAGETVAFDAPASGQHEAGVAAEFDLGPATKLLVAGDNVLAVEAHNTDIDSSDLSLIPEIESRRSPPRSDVQPVRINEAFFPAGDGGGAFVELYNPATERVSLRGYSLSDDTENATKLALPADAAIEPRGFIAVDAGALAASLAAGEGSVLFMLAGPDGLIVDALRASLPAREAGDPAAPDPDAGAGGDGDGPPRVAPSAPLPPLAVGRYPDGGPDVARLEPPTRGAPNRIAVAGDIVINEIMYHPISDDPADEYIELFNRGLERVALAGFRIRGGIRYDFAETDEIEPGGHLVVAADPAALIRTYGLPKKHVAGPFKGRLSDRGERIRLVDPAGNVVDSVEYSDRDPWPRWADGLGSSLELRHPALDNSLAASWEASDESSKSRWTHVVYRKKHRIFSGRSLDELQLLLLDQGECLIDDFMFGAKSNLVRDGSFEQGAAEWRALGTHGRSGIWGADAFRGKACYRIAADGRGDTRQNNVGRVLGQAPSPNQVYQVSFRVRWLRGSRHLLTRIAGQGVAKTHELEVPGRLGSPGAQNSRFADDPAPAVGVPVQWPVAPSTGEPVRFRVRLSSVTEIERAAIRYRFDGERGWAEAPLSLLGTPDADGAEWTGEVPPQPPGLVEFYVACFVTGGREASFPRDAPVRVAHYASGLIPNRRFPPYTLLVSAIEWDNLEVRPRMSNKLGNATLVYGDSRIFYNVGFRRRGSPWTRSRYNWRLEFGAETIDGRRSLTVDGQGGDGTRLNERLTYWLLDALDVPTPRQQYVFFSIPGREQGIYEDVEKIDGDFLERWFDAPAGGDEEAQEERTGILHKVDDYFELFPSGGRSYEEAFLEYHTEDPEDYRWNFPPRANGNSEDFRPLVELMRFFGRRATSDREFEARIDELLDAETWLRVLAARLLADDWDTLGSERGKNAFLYRSPSDGRWRLLPWDCDLSWRDPARTIFSAKFPGIRRLLEHPVRRRLYLGFIDYLATRKLGQAEFEEALGDLEKRVGARTDSFRQFALARRQFLERWIPDIPFVVGESHRVRNTGEPDLLRVAGTAPVMVRRFSLDGREGKVQFADDRRFVAEFPVGPGGADAVLAALNPSGGVVARTTVRVAERRGATPLPDEPPVRDLVLRREVPPAVSEPEPEEEGPASGGAPTPGPGVGVVVAPVPGVGPPSSGASASAPPIPPAVAASPGARSPLEAGERGDGEVTGDTSVFERRPRSLGRTPARSPGREPATREFDARSVERGGPAAGEAPGGGAAARRVSWGLLGGSLLVVGASALALVVLSRRRDRAFPPGVATGGNARRSGARLRPPRTAPPRPRPASPPPSSRPSTASPVAAAVEGLASADFTRAAAALERLNRIAADGVPCLLDALADHRRAPFRKIRRSGGGFTATPAEGGPGVPVRALAELYLRDLLGEPPVERPTPADWRRLWEASGGA